MGVQTQDLDVQLEALFSMAVAHMESQGINVEPAEDTSVAGPDRKRRKLVHVYQQLKQLLGDLRAYDKGENRNEASSGLNDHRGDLDFETSEFRNDASQLAHAPEMSDSREISVQDHDSDNDYGRSGTPEEIDNALLIPILGQVTGFCQNCNERPAQTVCYTCGTGRFCDFECWDSSRGNDKKHACSDVDLPWPACDFMQEIAHGSLPSNKHHFGFSKCRSLEEESTLLGLYRHLYLSHALNVFQLHRWWNTKQLYNSIVKTFTRRPHRANYTYVSWFKRRGNALFSEEDRSEVLNLDLFE